MLIRLLVVPLLADITSMYSNPVYAVSNAVGIGVPSVIVRRDRLSWLHQQLNISITQADEVGPPTQPIVCFCTNFSFGPPFGFGYTLL